MLPREDICKAREKCKIEELSRDVDSGAVSAVTQNFDFTWSEKTIEDDYQRKLPSS